MWIHRGNKRLVSHTWIMFFFSLFYCLASWLLFCEHTVQQIYFLVFPHATGEKENFASNLDELKHLIYRHSVSNSRNRAMSFLLIFDLPVSCGFLITFLLLSFQCQRFQSSIEWKGEESGMLELLLNFSEWFSCSMWRN